MCIILPHYFVNYLLLLHVLYRAYQDNLSHGSNSKHLLSFKYIVIPFKLLLSLELKRCLDAPETVFCHISHRLWLWRGKVPMFIPCIWFEYCIAEVFWHLNDRSQLQFGNHVSVVISFLVLWLWQRPPSSLQIFKEHDKEMRRL